MAASSRARLPRRALTRPWGRKSTRLRAALLESALTELAATHAELASAHAELARQQSFTDALLETVEVGIVSCDALGVFVVSNRAERAMFGLESGLEGLVSEDFAPHIDVVQPDGRRLSVDEYPLMRALRGEDLASVDVVVGPAGGPYREIVVRGRQMVSSDGSVLGAVAALTDVTAERVAYRALDAESTKLAEAHAELARRQSFTDAMLETIEVGIVSCDAAGAFMVTNRAERALYGIEESWQGLALDQIGARADLFDADGVRLGVEDYPLSRTLRGEDVSRVELRVGPAGGPHREVVVRGSQILGSDGAVVGAVAALTDVTVERSAARALADERRKLTEAQRLGQLGSFEFDFASGSWTFSEQMCELWGVEADGFVPQTTKDLVVEEDRQLFGDSWRRAAELGGRHSYEYRIRRANDGAERVIRSVIEVERGSDGKPTRGRGAHMDITDLHAARQAAQRANAFFDAVLTATPDYTFVSDIVTDAVIYGSPGKDILGITTEELEALGSEVIATLIHPDDQQRVYAVNAEGGALDDGQVLQIRYRGLHADGEWRWLNRRVTPFRRDASGRTVEVLSVVRDVTDVVQAEERLTHAARHDNLTGLPNRVLLVDRLDAALTRAARDGHEVAVLFCDLDGFKRVNDTGGHSAGDAVLLETARRLTSVLRGDDIVARVGGDEFVIVVEPWNRTAAGGSPGAPEAAGSAALDATNDRTLAVRVAERVVEALRRPIRVNDVDHVVTASVGITYATLTVDGSGGMVTADDALHDADAAMYLAKDHGKNRFEVFEPRRVDRTLAQPVR